MGLKVNYEWIVETLDGPDAPETDIAEVSHFDRFEEAVAWASHIQEVTRIGLTRDVGNDLEGLVDRSWAYLVEGALPERFEYCPGEGVAVPKRFRAEIARTSK